jgi:hypothetical protein
MKFITRSMINVTLREVVRDNIFLKNSQRKAAMMYYLKPIKMSNFLPKAV